MPNNHFFRIDARRAVVNNFTLTMTPKQILPIMVLAVCLLPFGAQANNIEEGKEFYTAVKAKNPIVLDGDLSEWTGANVIADPRFWEPESQSKGGAAAR